MADLNTTSAVDRLYMQDQLGIKGTALLADDATDAARWEITAGAGAITRETDDVIERLRLKVATSGAAAITVRRDCPPSAPMRQIEGSV